jgi:hypothetical protein
VSPVLIHFKSTSGNIPSHVCHFQELSSGVPLLPKSETAIPVWATNRSRLTMGMVIRMRRSGCQLGSCDGRFGRSSLRSGFGCSSWLSSCEGSGRSSRSSSV